MQTVGQEAFASLATSLSLFFSCAIVLQREKGEREKEAREGAESERDTHTHVVELWQVQRATFLANGIIISASDDSRSLCLCCLQPASTSRTAVRPPAIRLPLSTSASSSCDFSVAVVVVVVVVIIIKYRSMCVWFGFGFWLLCTKIFDGRRPANFLFFVFYFWEFFFLLF